MNVIYLQRQRVEIEAGTVTGGSEPWLIGERRYFVVYRDEDDASLTIWDGPHHADAVAAAEDWARDFSIPVIDRSGRQQ